MQKCFNKFLLLLNFCLVLCAFVFLFFIYRFFSSCPITLKIRQCAVVVLILFHGGFTDLRLTLAAPSSSTRFSSERSNAEKKKHTNETWLCFLSKFFKNELLNRIFMCHLSLDIFTIPLLSASSSRSWSWTVLTVRCLPRNTCHCWISYLGLFHRCLSDLCAQTPSDARSPQVIFPTPSLSGNR